MTERPGAHDPFLTHEALHTAMILTELVDNYLCEHEAVREKPAWLGLAEDARKALFNLYQAIGKEHLK